MLEPLRRFKNLAPGARGLFLRAAVLLPLISLSLRARGFRSTQLGFQKCLPKIASGSAISLSSGVDARVELTARMVKSAAHRSFRRATCLEKSVALWWLLGRQGIASSVRIGARKFGEKFEAHAWVEYNGVALNEPEEMHSHYPAFDETFPTLDQAKK
jgi:hypothetical protein